MFPVFPLSHSGSPSAASAPRTHRQLIVHLGPPSAREQTPHARTHALRHPEPARTHLVLGSSQTGDEDRHREAIEMADEVVVTEHGGQLDPRSLSALCFARMLGKPITWFENPARYCPSCRAVGPCAEHFFHQAMSLRALNGFLARCRGEHLPYLENQLVDWDGQIVPVILLANGLPALLVHLRCPTCGQVAGVAHAVAGQLNTWRTLLPPDGRPWGDGTEQENGLPTLRCRACARR